MLAVQIVASAKMPVSGRETVPLTTNCHSPTTDRLKAPPSGGTLTLLIIGPSRGAPGPLGGAPGPQFPDFRHRALGGAELIPTVRPPTKGSSAQQGGSRPAKRHDATGVATPVVDDLVGRLSPDLLRAVYLTLGRDHRITWQGRYWQIRLGKARLVHRLLGLLQVAVWPCPQVPRPEPSKRSC